MGPWPELLARPSLELSERQDREGVTQYRVAVEIVAGVMEPGYLLLPPERFQGPRPAVLVPFYAAEVSVNYAGPRPLSGQAARYFKDGPPVHRDFALQLARRGFVTLAIGTPSHLRCERMRARTGPAFSPTPPVKTIGMVEVAFFAANAEAVPPLVMIKSTLRPTRSAANAGSSSWRPSEAGG